MFLASPCTVYLDAYCMTYTVRRTLYDVHCTTYTVRRTLYDVHCTTYTVRRTLYVDIFVGVRVILVDEGE